VLTCLTRLTQRYREFPIEARPDLVKLEKYRREMLEMYAAERATGECIHSTELQRLVEWMTQVDIAEQYPPPSLPPLFHLASFLPLLYSSLISKRYRRTNLTKEEKDREKDREKDKAKERTESAWFHTCVKTTALMKQLIKGTKKKRN
jgi:hypothetical protein